MVNLLVYELLKIFSYITCVGTAILKHVTGGKMEGRIEMTRRRGRRRDKLLDEFKEKTGYWKLKEEALDRTLRRTRFGRGYGPDVRHNTE
jgi:hypothetical protein